MKLSSWLASSQAQLAEAGITTARLDCLVLLEDETEKDRAWLLSHPEYELQGSILESLHTKITQRAQHVPLAYIRGRAEFYGRDFTVSEHTLVPRPETETMVELVKELWTSSEYAKPWVFADIGTGSGAIAITTKLELPAADVLAVDIDPQCIRVAKQNAAGLRANISIVPGDLLEPLFGMVPAADVLLCNLPYVPNDFSINTAATHEPKHAIFGGEDGLELYRQLFNQLRKLSPKPRYILTESLPPQHEELAAIAKAAGYAVQKTDDFIQLFTR